MSSALPRERAVGPHALADDRPGLLHRVGAALGAVLRRRVPGRRRLAAFARRVSHEGRAWTGLSADGLRDAAAAVGAELRRDGARDLPVARAFALAVECAHRTLGLRPFDVQVQAGAVLLSGGLAELETGEGKTLAGALAAATAALSGLPVHVITANDYLVERDAALLRPVYEALGLSVAAIRETETDARARRLAWSRDVVYATGKQAAFDHLRDRLAARDGAGPGALLQARGLGLAIVDEADSILVDEARTPLVLARPRAGPAPGARAEAALALARALVAGRDFVRRHAEETLELTDRGRARAAELVARLGGAAALGDAAATARGREEIARQAITAVHGLRRDVHYVVRDGRVSIVDPHTGRVLPDRTWERGLHGLVERKEGCAPTAETETVARLTFPRFFRRYERLAGMTGTAREVAGELRRVYRLPATSIAPRLPLRRRRLPDRVFATAHARDAAVLERVRALHAAGRPVLVGTQSVARSEALSRMLSAAGLPHALLNAHQDREEAEIVARAGARGAITVATNMAGRGADIRLESGVEALGGLHVIAAERGEARRIDRQLLGRAGRQGDPGSGEVLGSLDDDLVERAFPPALRDTLRRRLADDGAFAAALRLRVLRAAQRTIERRHARIRRLLLDAEDDLERTLAFAGQGE